MRQPLRIVGLAVLALTMTSCVYTKFVSSWKDPAAGPLEFKKVLCVGIIRDQTTRRIVEDQLVSRIRARGAEAVASYSMFTEEELQDRERVKGKVLAAGFDGAVVMRLVGVDQQINYVSGTYPASYYSMWGYWGYAWPVTYDPGYLTTSNVYRVESTIYSIKDDKLIWAGVSETFEPASTTQLVDEIAVAASQELKRQGLIR